MREVKYLSPTSLSTFYNDLDAFYLAYMADKRPPRVPQTQPMSIGSSFDAYVKAFLYKKLSLGTDPAYEFEALFEAQVEPHNRDWAREHGAYAFECYKKSGALVDLLLCLSKSVGKPRFEFDVTGIVTHEEKGIMLKGKPDVFFINEHGAKVILDFKVNGYCSNSAVSPMSGYTRLRSAADQTAKVHKDAFLMTVNGMTINVGTYLERLNEDWARQLSFYSWLCGCEVGEDFIAAIDQLACGPGGDKPIIRIAEHRVKISQEFQQDTFNKAAHAWEVIHSDHFFRDMTKEQSQQRCKMLDGMAESLKGEGTSNDDWFSRVTRGV